MNQITLHAPCKINLSLDICGILPNGYHQMDMVMQTVSLGDVLSITKAEGLSMSCSDDSLPCDDSNIVLRCAKAFFEKAGIKPQAHFHLEKKVPMMAGLGGGSADGAAALCGLNKLFESGFSREELCELGFAIGADIPFCIVGGTKRVQGAGEVLSSAPALRKDVHILIVKPNFAVSTKLAFQGFDRQENPSRADVGGMMKALADNDIDEIGRKLANVFEPFCKPEEIGAIKETMLRHGAKGALMSGSGSAVFGIFTEVESAKACMEELLPTVEQADLCKPLSHGIFALCE